MTRNPKREQKFVAFFGALPPENRAVRLLKAVLRLLTRTKGRKRKR